MCAIESLKKREKTSNSRPTSPMIKKKLEPLTLLRMAIDAAAGMVYLSEAGFVVRILFVVHISLNYNLFFLRFTLAQHRDIAARNVLIDKEMTCRIGDFGLSVDLAVSDEQYV